MYSKLDRTIKKKRKISMHKIEFYESYNYTSSGRISDLNRLKGEKGSSNFWNHQFLHQRKTSMKKNLLQTMISQISLFKSIYTIRVDSRLSKSIWDNPIRYELIKIDLRSLSSQKKSLEKWLWKNLCLDLAKLDLRDQKRF